MASATKGIVVAGGVVLAGVVAARQGLLRGRGARTQTEQEAPALQREASEPDRAAPGREAPERAAPEPVSERESWQCACGQEFRVTGLDRHRIYWLADAPEAEPTLDDTCPNCDRSLPAGHGAG